MKTPEEYFKEWSANCRIFYNYSPLHSHEDMMKFAKDYHEQMILENIEVIDPEEIKVK
jgi:hypothetical protein